MFFKSITYFILQIKKIMKKNCRIHQRVNSSICSIFFGRILWNLPVSLRKLFRKLENNSKKLIKKEWSHKFNEICLNVDYN